VYYISWDDIITDDEFFFTVCVGQFAMVANISRISQFLPTIAALFLNQNLWYKFFI